MNKIYCSWGLLLIALVINCVACKKVANDPLVDPITPGVVPVINSVYPAAARGGDTITAKGKNLPTDISSIKITLNNHVAKIVKVTADSLQAIIPLMAGSGNITMSVGAKSYAGPEVEYQYQVIVTTVAGNGSVGNADGPPGTASFNCPWGIAVDGADNLFVADCYNRLIRKIAVSDQTVSTYTIPVLLDTNRFFSPYNLAVDKISGDMYVTDFNEHLMRMDAAGNMSVIYNATMPLAGIAISPDRKNLFISNNTNGTIIRTDMYGKHDTVFSVGLITPRNIIFNKQGKMFVAAYPGPIYEISSSGTSNRVVEIPGFNGWEIATDTLGNFYLADHFDNEVKMIDASGKMFTIAGSGAPQDIDGIGLEASFNGPQGITIDSKGNLYVTTYNYDTKGGNKVRKITIR